MGRTALEAELRLAWRGAIPTWFRPVGVPAAVCYAGWLQVYNVLLADDEVLERTYLRFILEKSRLCRCVFEASKGQEAVDFASCYPVDVTFMDVRMPVMNGLEAIQAIKRDHPDIIVIVNSAYAKFDLAKEDDCLIAQGHPWPDRPGRDDWQDHLTSRVKEKPTPRRKPQH
ncbi:MAG: response regulator [Bacillota bacterium]|jgi:CheY-like chemotaxis protein